MNKGRPIMNRLERAVLATLCGLLLLCSGLLDPDPMLPTWASTAIGMLVSGWLAWYVWHIGGEQG